ncbi:MAG: phosphoribosyltransferase family protein [Alcaligenaceae bacterium]
MSQANESDLWVTWAQYDDLIEQLAVQVQQSGFQFDQILCLARGGMRIGDVLSRVFNVPLAILATSSYRGAKGTEQGALNIAQQVTSASGPLSGNILLVDDLVDSGVTFSSVCDHLLHTFPLITAIKTAVLWQKAVSVFKPDYVVTVLETNAWIHQPFEHYDTMTVSRLVKKWSATPNK